RQSIATTRTESQYELGIIARWFEIGGEVETQDYEVGVLVSTTLEIVRKAHAVPDWSPGMQIDLGEQLGGNTFRHFVDALYILLDNVLKHAGPTAKTSIVITEDRGWLELRVSNAVEPERIKELKKRIKDVREHPIQGAKGAAVKREGGSGYYKLGKILQHDL